MPIYEYRCASCGYENEFLQKVNAPLLTECPECRKPTLEKQVTAAGFQLKGSGWYVTDFRDKGKKPAGGASADKDKPAADTGTTETKAAPTPDKPAEKKKEEKAQA